MAPEHDQPAGGDAGPGKPPRAKRGAGASKRRPAQPPAQAGRGSRATPPRPIKVVTRALLKRDSAGLHLPMVGDVQIPPPAHLAWYAGVATLAAFEILEWPVALVLCAGKLLVDTHHNQLLTDLGVALENAG